jgi:hypothetical protein
MGAKGNEKIFRNFSVAQIEKQKTKWNQDVMRY